MLFYTRITSLYSRYLCFPPLYITIHLAWNITRKTSLDTIKNLNFLKNNKYFKLKNKSKKILYFYKILKNSLKLNFKKTLKNYFIKY